MNAGHDHNERPGGRNVTSRLACRCFQTLLLAVLGPPGFAQVVVATPATELYEACSHLEAALKGVALAPQQLQQAGMCMGFIEAGFDGLTLGSITSAQAFGGPSIDGPKPAYEAMRRAGVRYACVPVDVPNRERLAIFMRYFEKNAASIRSKPPDEAPAVAVIMASLAEAYPCR